MAIVGQADDTRPRVELARRSGKKAERERSRGEELNASHHDPDGCICFSRGGAPSAIDLRTPEISVTHVPRLKCYLSPRPFIRRDAALCVMNDRSTALMRD